MASVWQEVGDGCFRRRYRSFDLNVGVVRGSDGLLLIDTRCHPGEARELLDDLRTLASAPVRRIVNSHWHFDHCWGNATIRDASPGVEIWGHERIVPWAEEQENAKEWLRVARPEWDEEIDSVELVAPDHFVVDTITLDLGDRRVSLRHPGRGHTDNDLVVVVPEVRVLFAGDIVENSGPPAYGDDSFPLDWPATNARLLEWIAPDATVVPGHGDVVDRAFVAEQQCANAQVATTIRDLHAAGVPEDRAVEASDWPFPRESMRDAVARGYTQLRGP